MRPTDDKSGYRELARDDAAVLYGYKKNKGKVKVAVPVVAVRGADDDWVADRLTACRVAEYGHCDWQSVRFLYWAPPGTPETLRATRLYLRDPRGIFRDQWAVPFLSSTTLSSGARYTGFRRDDRALAGRRRASHVCQGRRQGRALAEGPERHRLRLS